MKGVRRYGLAMTIAALCLPVLGRAAGAPAAAGTFELTTTAFADGADIPQKYTCVGSDVNPPLDIKSVPANTKSLALAVHDPDAPEGDWVHWVLYNIPPDKTSIPENSTAGQQALTDFGKYTYAGPCPPDSKPHHYVFTAYALDTVLQLNEGIILKDLDKAMKGHILASSTVTGVYGKPAW